MTYEKRGRQPTSSKMQISLKLEKEMFSEIEKLAKKEMRDPTNMIRFLLALGLKNYNKQPQ